MALFTGTGLGQKTPTPLTAGQMFAGAAQGIGKAVIDPLMESKGFISAENQVVEIMKEVDISSVDSVSEAFNKIMVISPEAASEFKAQVLPLVTAKQNELVSKAKGTPKTSDTKKVGYSFNGVVDTDRTMMLEKVNGEWKPIIDPSTKLPYSESKYEGDTYTGNIPDGYKNLFDDAGNVIGMEVIPGSPAEEKEKQLAEKKAYEKQYQRVEVSNLLDNIDIVEGMYNNRNVKVPVGPFEIGGDAIFSTEAKIYAQAKTAGTPRANMEEALVPIRASVGFDKLNQMRLASPTGGALGQVSNIELDALQKSISSLGLDQSPEVFWENVKQVRRHYKNIMKLMAATGSEEINDLKLDATYEVTEDEDGNKIVTEVKYESKF